MQLVWLSGNIVGHINEVTLRRAGLVLRWVTIRGYTVLVSNQAIQFTQPGHPSVGRHKLEMVMATAREETVSCA